MIDENERQLIKKNKVQEAVLLVRKRLSLSLKEAKDLVDEEAVKIGIAIRCNVVNRLFFMEGVINITTDIEDYKTRELIDFIDQVLSISLKEDTSGKYEEFLCYCHNVFGVEILLISIPKYKEECFTHQLIINNKLKDEKVRDVANIGIYLSTLLEKKLPDHYNWKFIPKKITQEVIY